MMVRSNLTLFAIAVMTMALAPAHRCLAQGKPPPLGPSITGANGLDDGQRAQVGALVNYWTEILKNSTSTPEEIEAARAGLIQPLTNIQPSLAFRYEYSRLVIPKLEEVVEGDNLHAIVNSMIIASMIGHDRSANFLIEHSDAGAQPTWQIRLQAAQGASNLLRGDTLDVRKLQNAADRLRDAAIREDNAMVLRHQLIAIDAADQNPVPPADRAKLRATMVDALVQVVDRLAKANLEDPQPMLAAVAEAASKVRGKFISGGMSTAEQSAVGKSLAPAMAKLLAIIAADWDNGRADERKQRSYSVIIGGVEGFLPAIDSSVRQGTTTLQTGMRQAWDAGNKAAFETELGKWTTVFQQPQYASGR